MSDAGHQKGGYFLSPGMVTVIIVEQTVLPLSEQYVQLLLRKQSGWDGPYAANAAENLKVRKKQTMI